MKILIGDKVYLQKVDVAFISHELGSIPGGILQEMFGDSEIDGFFYMSGRADGFRFDCVFTEPENVKWLLEQDWILDYDEYSDAQLFELEDIQDRLKAEYSAGIEDFNARDFAYRKAHLREERDRFNQLSHKIASFEDLIQFRRGDIKFVFPKEYQGKTNYFWRLWYR